MDRHRDWKHLLAYITGTVDQELLLRHTSRVTENRILRNQLQERVRLSDGERQSLAEMGQTLGRQALEEIATMVKPDTMLAWPRKLMAQTFDGSQPRNAPGRPPINADLEALVVRLAQDNRRWGSDRSAGALQHRGYTISDQTVGHLLKRHGIPPAPERKHTTTWHECIGTPMEVLVATDFFTAEVWTIAGFVTSYGLLFIHLASRKVQGAGVTPPPDARWMVQVARQVTMAEWGGLSAGQYLIHDRDGTYCPALQRIIDEAGGPRVPLPPWSPGLHADAERGVRSVKDEALSRLILCGERSRRYALTPYEAHDHTERPHHGTGKIVLMPARAQGPGRKTAEGSPLTTPHARGEAGSWRGPVALKGCERLGGLLKDDYHDAA